MPNSPCMECKDRCLGCHQVCRSYKEWAVQMKELNHKKRMESYSATSTRPEARENERERKRRVKNKLMCQR